MLSILRPVFLSHHSVLVESNVSDATRMSSR